MGCRITFTFSFFVGREHTIADTVGRIKSSSPRWVHDTFPQCAGFAWQAGYGAFSVSVSQIDVVTNYIQNQAEHHRAMSFQNEFRWLLKNHGVVFDERYVWD